MHTGIWGRAVRLLSVVAFLSLGSASLAAETASGNRFLTLTVKDSDSSGNRSVVLRLNVSDEGLTSSANAQIGANEFSVQLRKLDEPRPPKGSKEEEKAKSSDSSRYAISLQRKTKGNESHFSLEVNAEVTAQKAVLLGSWKREQSTTEVWAKED